MSQSTDRLSPGSSLDRKNENLVMPPLRAIGGLPYEQRLVAQLFDTYRYDAKKLRESMPDRNNPKRRDQYQGHMP